MKNSIAMIFVSLTAYVWMASAQLPTGLSNPFFFYPNYNTPPVLPAQKIAANEMVGKQFSGYDDHSIQNTLGSHVVLLTTCLSELKSTKSNLAETHTEVESIKKELTNVMVTVENLKKLLNASENEKVKQELKENSQLLANVAATVENLKKEMNAGAASSIGRMPRSCDDLQKIGHRKSGLFSVMGNKTVDNVYCDFTKPTNDAGFQKTIGYVDVKTSPVHFHALRTSAYGTASTTLPFDYLRLNLGNGMTHSGIFVAPTPGKYYFAFSGICSSNTAARVQLQVKTVTTGWERVATASGAEQYETFSVQSTLELAKGDQVRLYFVDGATYDDGVHYTNFVGMLLEEDILIH